MRWQIELVFKRLKSLLRLGHVPKKNDLSALAWIQAKLLIALIIERLSVEARFFPPWGFEVRTKAFPLA
jgi:IS4 transposase